PRTTVLRDAPVRLGGRVGRVPPRLRRLDPAAAHQRLRGRGPDRGPTAGGGRARRSGRPASGNPRRPGSPRCCIHTRRTSSPARGRVYAVIGWTTDNV